MYCVWKAYLEGTVQVTQARIATCDNYKVQIGDPVKTARLQKEQQLRKVNHSLSGICSGFNYNSVKLHRVSLAVYMSPFLQSRWDNDGSQINRAQLGVSAEPVWT